MKAARSAVFRRGADLRGFTLVEMAFVILLLGIAIAALSPLYNQYIESRAQLETARTVQNLPQDIGDFLGVNGRYPCPASLDAAPGDPDYGREDCSDQSALADGQCVGTARQKICVKRSLRNVGLFKNPWTNANDPSQFPRIRIGFVPFRNLGLEESAAYDANGMRILYAVTENLMFQQTFDPAKGGVDIKDGAGNSLLNPAGSAHFLVFSVGENMGGGWTRAGIQTPCPAGRLDAANCDFTNAANINFVFRSDKNVATGAAAPGYDDVMAYFTNADTPLWQYPTAQNLSNRNDIQVRSGGNLGIAEPVAAVDVDKHVLVEGVMRAQPVKDPANPGQYKPNTGRLMTQGGLCKNIGDAFCLHPERFGGTIAAGGGMRCPEDDHFSDPEAGDDATAITGSVLVAIKQGRPVCRDPEITCDAAKPFFKAVKADGTPDCEVLPPGCPALAVTMCSGYATQSTQTIPPGNADDPYSIHGGIALQQDFWCTGGVWTPTGAPYGPFGAGCVSSCSPGSSTVPVACPFGTSGVCQVTTTTTCDAIGLPSTTSSSDCGSVCVCNDGATYTYPQSCENGYVPGATPPTVTYTAQCATPTGSPNLSSPVFSGGCVCAPSSTVVTEACPSDPAHNRSRTVTNDCAGGAAHFVEGAWDESACVGCANSSWTQQEDCPPGEEGYMIRTYTSTCPGPSVTSEITYSGCATIPSGCTSNCVPPDLPPDTGGNPVLKWKCGGGSSVPGSTPPAGHRCYSDCSSAGASGGCYSGSSGAYRFHTCSCTSL